MFPILLGCGPGTWLADYDDAVAELSSEYAFNAHKELDWSDIDAEIRPLVQEAARREDDALMDEALRRLVGRLPDNHIGLAVPLCPQGEAGFGVVLSDSDEGVIVAAVTNPDLPIAPGERVLEWNGAPINRGRTDAPTQCLAEGIATTERRAFEELRWLPRGEWDEQAYIGLEGGDLMLEPFDDADAGLAVFEYPDVGGLMQLQYELREGYGYVVVRSEEGPRTLARMERAIQAFQEAGLERMVLDLRGNVGGLDGQTAKLASLFHEERRFYEDEAAQDETGTWTVVDSYDLEPREVLWTGRTAVLIDGFTVSSGEGLAMAVGWAPEAFTVGFEGTAASFGFTGPSVRIGGRTLVYPDGQSWDANGAIQLDSDASGEGGVVPDHLVPWTVDNRVAYAAGEDVVLAEALRLLGL